MLMDMGTVEPINRTLNSEFKFRCHNDISCFTKCCSRTNILLTPYDIIRIKDRLGISSGDFLEKYTYTYIDEEISHPYAVLKMMDDNKGKCPFVAPEGCSIYEDRPSNCRYYPVGQGLMIVDSDKGPVKEEFYFFIRDPNCLGYQGDREWSIGSWRIEQGAALEYEKEEIEKIKIEEIALMKFGFKYLKYILMLEETLKVRDEYKKGEHSHEAEGF